MQKDQKHKNDVKKDKRQSLYKIKLNDDECNFVKFFSNFRWLVLFK